MIESFKRKITRFTKILNESKGYILLVYINEDYLYNEEYRETETQNYNNLIMLSLYLKKTYPTLKFHILNISFKKRQNSNRENIINIYYKSNVVINRNDWLENSSKRGYVESEFRDFCKNAILNFILKHNNKK